MIPVNRPIISEDDVHAVLKALRDTEISGTSGSVRDLEECMQDFLSVEFFVATSNGTSSIDCITDTIEFKQDDNVVIPALTIISTASNLIRKGVRMRIVDVEIDTFMPTNNAFLAKIDSKTKLAIPTHIYGLIQDVHGLQLELQNSETLLVEDAAEVFGVQNQEGVFVGTEGYAGSYSFYANKNITGGEGGGVATNSAVVAGKIREIRNLGFSQTGERFIHNVLGWNARMPGMSAALIKSQLERINQVLDRKKAIGSRYLKNLQDHPWLNFQATKYNGVDNSYWVFAILATIECPFLAADLRDILFDKGVETRRFFYPLHLQPIIKESGLIESAISLPNSEYLWEHGLYLPSGPGTTNEEIDKVSEILWNLINESKNVAR